MSALCRAAAVFCAAMAAYAAEPASMSGSWRVNVARSDWGSRPKPASVTLQIQHREPALAYSGVVIYTGEDARSFSFSGEIDGREYPMDRSFGTGTVTLRRIDAVTIESVFRSADGSATETTRTTMTLDGRTLTRRIRTVLSGVVSTSTEIYNRN